TTRLALEFATFRKNLDPRSWVQRLCAVRAFALYWQGFDPKTEVPPEGLLRYPAKRARPRFCSEAQIVRLLELARGVPPSEVHGLRPWTLYTVFGLLSVSGMRISEALHLKSVDIDLGRRGTNRAPNALRKTPPAATPSFNAKAGLARVTSLSPIAVRPSATTMLEPRSKNCCSRRG